MDPYAPTQLGRYLVEHEVGRGGMSVVYRGVDPALGRTVALKVLHPHLANRAESRARFQREAKAVARLAHPSIVEVYDFAPPESERAYIVTQYIDGPTLRALAEVQRPRFPEIAAMLMIPIFEALDHAHASGIVHRDVKPENIMVSREGLPVLMDFGIAQLVDMETLTQTGTILGSPAHMAPEVVDGQEVTSKADTFSAATVLYWLVCGVLPFSGPNPAALFRRILECKFDPVLSRNQTAGRALARLIEQCLQRDPALRPDSAMAVADALRALLREASLTDSRAELRAWFIDPAGYEAAFPGRVVPAYLAASTAAIKLNQLARATDFLDRVLSMEPGNARALSLLGQLERGSRRQRRLRLAGAGLVAVSAVVGISLLLPSVASVRDDAAGLPRLESPDAAIALLLPGAPISAFEVLPPKTPTSVASAAPLPASLPIASPSRPPQPRTARPRVRLIPPAEVQLPSRSLVVDVRADPWNTEVYVDGVRHGYVYEVRTAGGLPLSPGSTHILDFRHEACERTTIPVTILPDQQKVPAVITRCKYLPARLRVQANRDLPVHRDDNGQLLGQTNADILVRMTGLRAELRLTIGDPTDTLLSRRVNLAAGKSTTENIEF